MSGSRHFITAVAIAWLVSGVAGGEVQVAPQIAQASLLLICLPFYTAAAARSRGLIDTSPTGRGLRESTFWLGMSRPGIEVAPIFTALLLLLIACAGFIGGALIAKKIGDAVITEETGAAIGLGGAALACLVIMARIWPVFSVPFFFRGKYRWSPAAGGPLWSGPCLGMALRLSRLPMARKLATPTFMTPFMTLLTPLFALRLYWGASFILNVLFYAVALPYLGMLNLKLTGQLLAENQRQQHQSS